MTEKLDNALSEVLMKFLDGLDKTVDFASAQIPDAIEQLLQWYFIYYLILAIFAVVLFGIQAYSSYYWVTKVEPKINELNRWTGTIFGVGAAGFLLLLAEIGMFNLTWLKIWIAPKIWLIEYSSQLIKG